MQITQECWEYDLTTNSVKFMQQTTLSLSEGDSSVCSLYLLQYIYLINSTKVKASDENVHFWHKHKLAGVYALHLCDLHQWRLLQCMLHVNHPLLQFADIKNSLLSTATLFSRCYSHRIQTWATKAASYLAWIILRSHVQHAVEIGSNCNFQVSQGSQET